MIFVILISRKFGINPDNVATPIAASLGDLVTLLLLSYIVSVSQFLQENIYKKFINKLIRLCIQSYMILKLHGLLLQ